MNPTVLRCSLLLAFWIIPSVAAGQTAIDGKWVWNSPSSLQQLTMELHTEGRSLKGSLTMRERPDPDDPLSQFREYFFKPVVFEISQGSIAGNRIEFQHDNYVSVGGDEKEIFKYTGVIDGGRILMTREYSARPGSAALGYHKVEFVMTRAE